MKLRKALYIFVLVLLAVFLIQVILAQSGSRPSPTPTPGPTPTPSPLIGGCAGTRYGCCPDGRTPRANYRGTNCH